jgi:hypothetical protein
MASQKSNLITNSDTVPSVMNDVGKSGGRVRIQTDNFEWLGTTMTTAADFCRLCRVPTNARLISFVIWNDDLDSNGSPTLVTDLGIYPIASDTAVSSDCLADGDTSMQSATVGAGTELLCLAAADLPNMGKPLWEVAGLSTDPGGLYDICITLQVPAATDVDLTFAFRCMYTVD